MTGFLDLDGLDGAAPETDSAKARLPQTPAVAQAPAPPAAEETVQPLGDAAPTVPAVQPPADLAVELPMAEAVFIDLEEEDLATPDLGDMEVASGDNALLDQPTVPISGEPALPGDEGIAPESWAAPRQRLPRWPFLVAGLILLVLVAIFFGATKSGWLLSSPTPEAASGVAGAKLETELQAPAASEATVPEAVSETADASQADSQSVLAPPTAPLVVRFPGRFGTNKKKAKGAKPRRLKKVLAQLEACAGQLTLAGHASDDEKKPLRLSLARAKRAAKLLVAQGLDPGRLATAGKGSAEPAHTKSTRVERKKNRRVMIHCQNSPP